jgi:hypothetical protein
MRTAASLDEILASLEADNTRLQDDNERLQAALALFDRADNRDWEWLYARVANAGHGRFWIGVFDEFRAALAASK